MAHILLTGNTAWGMYNFRGNLIRLLLQRGHIVTVVAPADKKYEEKITHTGCSFVPISINSKGTNPVTDLLLIRKYYLLYRSISPDFIFHYTIKPNIYGSLAACFARIPSIAVITGLGYTYTKKGIVNGIAHVLYRIAFSTSRQVWFLNEDDRALFVAKKIVKSYKTVVLKGEGIDLDQFSSAPFSNSNISFLLASRMLMDKGIGEYVAAARILKQTCPEVNFKLLGPLGINNPTAISYEQIDDWQREGIVSYLGETDNIIPFIRESTAIVLPSYREGIPRVLLEAAAIGRPIITTNCIGCKDVVVDNVTGFLCKPKDPEDLAAALLKVISLNKRDIALMGQKGREFVEKEFSDKVVLERYIYTLKEQGMV